MNDALKFNNDIHYMAVSPEGAVEWSATVKNAVGPRTKDAINRALTVPSLGSAGSLVQINYAYFRLDGSSILGTGLTWVAGDSSGTIISTRFGAGTYVGSCMFSATYTATANTTCKAVCLLDSVPSSSTDMGSMVRFWSTNVSVVVSNGGRIIVQWTINVP